MLFEILTAIILHNPADKASRDFIGSIPNGADVQIIDWYNDDAARYAYIGPPPSAFPTVILNMPDGTQGTMRAPKTWADASAAIAAPTGKAETVVTPGTYIGGVTLQEANNLAAAPTMSKTAKSAITTTLQSPTVQTAQGASANAVK